MLDAVTSESDQIAPAIFSIDAGEDEIQRVGAEWKVTKAMDFYGVYTNFDNASGSSLDVLFSGLRYKF